MTSGDFAGRVEGELRTLLNQERERRGLETLRERETLTRAAERYSRDMAAGSIGRDGNAGAGAHAPDRYDGVEGNCARVARHGSPAELAHELASRWMQSSGDRSDLLADDAKYHGVGIWTEGDSVYATHMLAVSDRKARRGRGAITDAGARIRAVGALLVGLPAAVLVGLPAAAGRRLLEKLSPSMILLRRERQLLYGSTLGAIGFCAAAVAYAATLSEHAGVTGPLTEHLAAYSRWAFLESGEIEALIRRGRLIAGVVRLGRPITSGYGITLVATGLLASYTVSRTRRLGKLRYALTNATAAVIGYAVGAVASMLLLGGPFQPDVLWYVIAHGLVLTAAGGLVLWGSDTLVRATRAVLGEG